MRRHRSTAPLLGIGALLLAAHPNPSLAQALTEAVVAADFDWQPIKMLPAEQQDLQCKQCNGAYVDPLANVPRNTPPESSKIEISAAKTEVSEGQLQFSGGVTVRQGYQQMTADEASFDRTTDTAVAVGDIELREPGVMLRGASVTYDSRTREAAISNALFTLHEAHLAGVAGELLRRGDGDIEISDGAVTFCAPDDPSWILRTDRLELEPDSGVGEARGVSLEVAGTPVLYLPWLQFPIDDRRKSGLLFPDIGSDTRGGLDVTVPAYWNLAPNYDLLYSPRLIQERGLLHQVTGRWLNDRAGLWEIDGAWMSDDAKYRGDAPNNDGERWLFGLRQRADIGGSWRTEIDYNKVSDADYIRDLDNQTLSAQRQTSLLQLARIDWLGKDWIVQVEAQQFQQLADDIRDDYKKLPQITAQWRGTTRFEQLEPIALVQYSNFDSDDQRITGQRLYSEVGGSYPMQWQSGFLRPTIKYRHLSYALEGQANDEDRSPDAGSAVLSLDAGLVFERETTLAGEAMTQTLEPRAYYLYSSFTEQQGLPDFDSAELTFSYNQLFRATRFSGNDRLDDANQMALGVTTRFFSDADGRERLNASIGQIIYFRDREVRLITDDPALDDQGSSVAAELNWLPSDAWSVRSSLLYDPYESNFEAASFQVQHRPGNGSVFNVGYAKREPLPSLQQQPVNEQANLSAYYPLNDHWSVFGALEYSLESSNSVEDMVGVEYDDCCWRVRMLYMRYVDTASGLPDFTNPDFEKALQFQFVLKGMGGFGSRVDNLMRDMIRGFTDRY
ncbi:MAG: LPS-assembly protein LptD [Halieaceae bacterium]|nr:LPS-assembly protein LptD [Halieaceae bacterium]